MVSNWGYNGYNGYNPRVNGVYFSFSILKHLCLEVSDFLLERCFCRQIHEMNTVRIGQMLSMQNGDGVTPVSGPKNSVSLMQRPWAYQEIAMGLMINGYFPGVPPIPSTAS